MVDGGNQDTRYLIESEGGLIKRTRRSRALSLGVRFTQRHLRVCMPVYYRFRFRVRPPPQRRSLLTINTPSGFHFYPHSTLPECFPSLIPPRASILRQKKVAVLLVSMRPTSRVMGPWPLAPPSSQGSPLNSTLPLLVAIHLEIRLGISPPNCCVLALGLSLWSAL